MNSAKQLLIDVIQQVMKNSLEEVYVKISHDRNGEYKPQITGKYDRNTEGIEERN